MMGSILERKVNLSPKESLLKVVVVLWEGERLTARVVLQTLQACYGRPESYWMKRGSCLNDTFKHAHCTCGVEERRGSVEVVSNGGVGGQDLKPFREMADATINIMTLVKGRCSSKLQYSLEAFTDESPELCVPGGVVA